MLNFKEENDVRDGLILLALACVLCLVIVCAGCNGNSASVKPNTDLDNRLKTSLDNQQEMTEKIQQLNGQLIKIQQNISNITNTIITAINQRFETFQDSVSNKIGEVGGDVKTKTSKSQNSALYGIGLVGTVLLFVLAALWLAARVLKEIIEKRLLRV